MAVVPRDNQLPILATLMAGALVAGFFLLWRTASPLSQWVGVDLDFLYPPLAFWSVLMLLSRLVGWASETRLGWSRRWGEHSRRDERIASGLAIARRALSDLAWAGSALVSIAAIPALVEAIDNRVNVPGLGGALPYVNALGQLPNWGLPILAFLTLIRAVSETRPVVANLIRTPWRRLTMLGASYVLLADGGMLDAGFGVAGFTLWLAFAVAVGIAYAALILRRALRLPLGPRALRVSRISLVALEAAWIGVGLWFLSILSGLVETILVGHFALEPARATAYVASLDELMSPGALMVMAPFAMARALGVYWPKLDKLVGFPVGHLVSLGAVYVLFSESGTLWVSLQVSGSEFMTVLSMGLALSYAGSVMRNLGSPDLAGRFGPAVAGYLRLASMGLLALAIGLTIEVMLSHMAIANAVLLDFESTREFGRAALPYFSVLLESRVGLAAMAGAMVFVWSLPWIRDDAWVSWQPVMNAVCYAGAGCLAWLAGAALSPIGHGLLLAGATSGAGLLTIALVQLLRNDAILRHATLAAIATWLLASRARGFVLGGAAAVYLMILRPALYEVLWFAALYEYIAVLALMAAAALFVLGLFRRGVEPEGESEHDSGEWQHHEQTLESKDDPRTELAAVIRQRFVDFGEWKPLWTYLMGLLFQNGASQEGMTYVCRPLRSSAISSAKFQFLQRSNLRRLTRAAALATALRRMEDALADRPIQSQPLDEEAIREAAALFINSGAGVERLAIALTVAHCQQGLDLDSAIDQWFPLLNTPDPASIRFNLPWTSRSARLRDRQQRIQFVDGAVTMILGASTIARDMNAPESLATLVGSTSGGAG